MSTVLDFTAITALVSGDLIYVVRGIDSTRDKKITIDNLFTNVPVPVSFADTVSVVGTLTANGVLRNTTKRVRTTTWMDITSGGAVEITPVMVWLVDAGASSWTLSAGVMDGEVRVIRNHSGVTHSVVGNGVSVDGVTTIVNNTEVTAIYHATTTTWHLA